MSRDLEETRQWPAAVMQGRALSAERTAAPCGQATVRRPLWPQWNKGGQEQQEVGSGYGEERSGRVERKQESTGKQKELVHVV